MKAHIGIKCSGHTYFLSIPKWISLRILQNKHSTDLIVIYNLLQVANSVLVYPVGLHSESTIRKMWRKFNSMLRTSHICHHISNYKFMSEIHQFARQSEITIFTQHSFPNVETNHRLHFVWSVEPAHSSLSKHINFGIQILSKQ